MNRNPLVFVHQHKQDPTKHCLQWHIWFVNAARSKEQSQHICGLQEPTTNHVWALFLILFAVSLLENLSVKQLLYFFQRLLFTITMLLELGVCPKSAFTPRYELGYHRPESLGPFLANYVERRFGEGPTKRRASFAIRREEVPDLNACRPGNPFCVNLVYGLPLCFSHR